MHEIVKYCPSTIMDIILWDFLILYQIFFSPQVKRKTFSPPNPPPTTIRTHMQQPHAKTTRNRIAHTRPADPVASAPANQDRNTQRWEPDYHEAICWCCIYIYIVHKLFIPYIVLFLPKRYHHSIFAAGGGLCPHKKKKT